MVDREVKFLLQKVLDKATLPHLLLFSFVVDFLSRLESVSVDKGLMEGFKVGWIVFICCTSNLQITPTFFSLRRKGPSQILMVSCLPLKLSQIFNHQKESSIIGLNNEPSKLSTWASLPSCELSQLPFSYLCSLGGKSEECALLDPF